MAARRDDNATVPITSSSSWEEIKLWCGTRDLVATCGGGLRGGDSGRTYSNNTNWPLPRNTIEYDAIARLGRRAGSGWGIAIRPPEATAVENLDVEVVHHGCDEDVHLTAVSVVCRSKDIQDCLPLPQKKCQLSVHVIGIFRHECTHLCQECA